MTAAEISDKSGLAVETVHWLSRQASWSEIPVSTFRAFSIACGMDFTDSQAMRRADQYIKKRLLRKINYLKKDADWPLFKELLSIWAKSNANPIVS